MGFGNVVTTLLMFIAVLILATGVIVTMNTNVQKTQNSMQVQAEYLNNQIKTNIGITNVNYSGGELLVYALNDGSTTLKTTKIDIYVDGLFIPRNETARNITVEASTDLTNPGLWDPDELILLNISTTLSAGQHVVKIITQYEQSDQETFST